jgi:hypothetical protein
VAATFKGLTSAPITLPNSLPTPAQTPTNSVIEFEEKKKKKKRRKEEKKKRRKKGKYRI